MALIVENGSIVTNADSYVTRAEFITYAATLGVTIADTEATDIILRKAAQFIDAHEGNLKGYKVSRDQPMAYPRSYLTLESWNWNSNEIPRQVILAQFNIALDINAGIDPFNPPVNPQLAKQSVSVQGAVSVTYAIGNSIPQKVGKSSTATAIMSVLLKNSGLSIALERS